MYETGERNDDYDDVTVVPGTVDNEDGNSGFCVDDDDVDNNFNDSVNNIGCIDYCQTDFH